MPVWDDVDDVELLKTAQDGNAEAYGEIYERYAPAIFRYVYAHLSDRHDAEDLTEEVFLRVWRSLPNYRQRGVPFVAYLYHVARNALVDHHRRSKYVAQNVSIEDGQLASHESGPAEVLVATLEHQELHHVLQKLRSEYRDVLVLRFLAELSPEETARAMEKSVGSVRVLQHRALAAVRKLLVRNQDE